MPDSGPNIEERLQRLEQQNEQILGLLEKIAGSGFAYERKKLPAEKPDFAKVEEVLRAAVETPELSALVALEDFVAKDWVAEARLREKFSEYSRANWEKIYAMIEAVSAECGIPGRMAGSYSDPEDWRRHIASRLHFGYSREVGYDHESDFHIEPEEPKK
jgi:hypothetical protein